MVTWATCDILASASPLKPYVLILLRSSNFVSLLVVNLSHTIVISSFWNTCCWVVISTQVRFECTPFWDTSYLNSCSIVLDLNQLQPTIAYCYLNVWWTCIDTEEMKREAEKRYELYSDDSKLSRSNTNQFSIISLMALAGRWITSPAAILLTTVSSNLLIVEDIVSWVVILLHVISSSIRQPKQKSGMRLASYCPAVFSEWIRCCDACCWRIGEAISVLSFKKSCALLHQCRPWPNARLRRQRIGCCHNLPKWRCAELLPGSWGWQEVIMAWGR